MLEFFFQMLIELGQKFSFIRRKGGHGILSMYKKTGVVQDAICISPTNASGPDGFDWTAAIAVPLRLLLTVEMEGSVNSYWEHATRQKIRR
jgi:hypothetical protein